MQRDAEMAREKGTGLVPFISYAGFGKRFELAPVVQFFKAQGLGIDGQVTDPRRSSSRLASLRAREINLITSAEFS